MYGLRRLCAPKGAPLSIASALTSVIKRAGSHQTPPSPHTSLYHAPERFGVTLFQHWFHLDDPPANLTQLADDPLAARMEKHGGILDLGTRACGAPRESALLATLGPSMASYLLDSTKKKRAKKMKKHKLKKRRKRDRLIGRK
uniref:Ribosomal protein mS38 C-terminal domain-containing protein n=1 Tax=Calcidiscus leptoporus TaxID=127549 RepID=A0A7S0JHX3_9EUKA